MKKRFSIILAILMTLSIVSCTSTVIDNPSETPVISDEPTTLLEDKPTQEPIKAAVFWYDFADAFLTTVRTALNAELNTLGIKHENYDAAKTQATQNDQIDSAIANGVDLLIVNIVDTAAVDAAQVITDKAKAAEIPIIFFNREVENDVINSYENACFVGTRAAEAGELQGQMAGEYIVDNYDQVDLNGDGYISYIMMRGEISSIEYDTSYLLTHYCLDFCNAHLEEADKPELIYYDINNTDYFQPCGWAKTNALNAMENAISSNPMDSNNPIELVLANNDDLAMGCVEALNAIGWNTGEPNSPSIPVFGVDYTAYAQTAIEAGKMTGSIHQTPTGMAETIADLVENVMNGDHVFANTENFNIDKSANKIRVPYEIKLKEEN